MCALEQNVKNIYWLHKGRSVKDGLKGSSGEERRKSEMCEVTEVKGRKHFKQGMVK